MDVYEFVRKNYVLVHKETIKELLDKYEDVTWDDGYHDNYVEDESKRFDIRKEIDALLKIESD